jgi:hypothetical protein
MKLKKVLSLFSLLVTLSYAQETNNSSVSVSLMHSVFCPFQNEAWECARLYGGRALNKLFEVIHNKRDEILAQADRDVVKVVQARGLSIPDLDGENRPSAVYHRLIRNIRALPEVFYGALLEFLEPGQYTTAAEENSKIKTVQGRGIIKPRGIKQKAKFKLIEKVLQLSALIKTAIGLVLSVFSIAQQIGLLLLAKIAIIANVVLLFMQYQKQAAAAKKPLKTVYYENASHTHTYDDHHHIKWGRSFNVASRLVGKDSHSLAYPNSRS